MIKAQDLEIKGFVGQIVGPIFLMCTLFLAGHVASVPNYDLVAIAVIGLFLCAKRPIRGCLFAIALLVVCSSIKHFFMSDHHLWQASFEGSVALSFMIIALVFHERASFIESLGSQNLAHRQTIQYLEDDLVKLKGLSAEESLASLEKLSVLQSQLEEAITESSSYQMLNDVIRKSTAKAIEEKELISDQFLQSDRRAGNLLSEIDVLQKELCRIGNESVVVQQNGQLFNELNGARVKEAQTHLVNETLARMHRSEHGRAKELESKHELALEQLLRAQQEILHSTHQIGELTAKLEALGESQVQCDLLTEKVQIFERELTVARQQLQTAVSPARETLLLRQIETLQMELAEASGQLQMMIPLEREAFLLKEIELLETALAVATQQIQLAPSSITPEREAFLLGEIEMLVAERAKIGKETEEANELKEQLQILQTRLDQFTKLELLYRELKGNFQEKNTILHKTRVELFHVDTELQTLKQEIQQKSLEIEPMPLEIASEIEEIEAENRALILENTILQDLVSHLMATEDLSVKKKVKKKVLAEQQDLFILDESF